ncbi:NADPH-dependent 7-cyano-7-deazaguanine reductase QueF [Buchnera aphidicola (Melanaphis sacchari)]|uniref:NADPH-dependent 7-cyano-7-deazaguanine reductase QueF n=1 Tax=Buchnera aphidicola (Melanaphis sacchari) TaxID=2173854 RepID=A0A2U8DF93_9GAMM|nr:NADPH-dependent 7-cyano-7-deazaguanine reductase QueF [Buchnera aphidicola]AWH90490.1 NADPH-dependent 7-cyano-7-deazaguanine reductase QueF [Buchnera aphidicola (Melanaphis sacchari)]
MNIKNYFNLLKPIPRIKNRKNIKLNYINLPFKGKDIWTLYELSWLNIYGIPQVAVGKMEIDANSTNIIESKSLKLYLNSFNQVIINDNDFLNLIISDLSKCVCGKVSLKLFSLEEIKNEEIVNFDGYCIDNLNIKINSYFYDKKLLSPPLQGDIINESLYSNLFKSNCPITQQPDWASIYISYTGQAINHNELLCYLISFRLYNEFHEECVERIFNDINNICTPKKLSVYARYTRRGGIDINPWRSNTNFTPSIIRLSRQ